MNFLGIGPLELIAIVLIAFIVLGPSRLAETARFLGKTLGQVQKATRELSQMTNLDMEEKTQESKKAPSESPQGKTEDKQE